MHKVAEQQANGFNRRISSDRLWITVRKLNGSCRKKNWSINFLAALRNIPLTDGAISAGIRTQVHDQRNSGTMENIWDPLAKAGFRPQAGSYKEYERGISQALGPRDEYRYAPAKEISSVMRSSPWYLSNRSRT
ncbi:hypothetical protein TNCV_2364411 [Trichonephila clavipes]|nr:hypothetical protein TNCV_2364411 [Trichonephila clavipes]